jgi:hypothetical protein
MAHFGDFRSWAGMSAHCMKRATAIASPIPTGLSLVSLKSRGIDMATIPPRLFVQTLLAESPYKDNETRPY